MGKCLYYAFEWKGLNMKSNLEEILSLMSEGLGSDEIAKKLGISKHTVKAYMSVIAKKEKNEQK